MGWQGGWKGGGSTVSRASCLHIAPTRTPRAPTVASTPSAPEFVVDVADPAANERAASPRRAPAVPRAHTLPLPPSHCMHPQDRHQRSACSTPTTTPPS